MKIKELKAKVHYRTIDRASASCATCRSGCYVTTALGYSLWCERHTMRVSERKTCDNHNAMEKR